MTKAKRGSVSRFDLRKLVRVIGFHLTAYIGKTNVVEVYEWLKRGLPKHLEERMQAAFDVACLIKEVEFELVAQAFLWGNLDAMPAPDSPATMLRDAVNIQAARAVLIEIVRKEFLLNVADNLEDVEARLKEWIRQTKTPSGTLYKVGINRDRLWLQLLHAGFSLEQQSKWDCGEEWPLWEELIAAVPEMAISRVAQNIDTGCPFRYLRRSCK
jgi:hypothetical protein